LEAVIKYIGEIMDRYGHKKRGSELPQAKLTEEDIHLIREIHAQGKKEIERIRSTMSAQALAEKFEVSRHTIHRVLRYDDWRHVK
jgi:DNA invertase Pin-like site-specific DNA recombinase